MGIVDPCRGLPVMYSTSAIRFRTVPPLLSSTRPVLSPSFCLSPLWPPSGKQAMAAPRGTKMDTATGASKGGKLAH